jgi:hypothetical protein
MQDVIRKLKFKEDGIVINAPVDLKKEFLSFGFNSSFVPKVQSKNTLVFILNSKEFFEFLNNQIINVEFDSVLWFAYPKGTSKIKTDIHRDTIRITGEKYNITTVAAISINDTWSALRFRPIDRVGK